MERRSCCSGFVYLDITEDVAVFLPAYKLNGLCLKGKKMEVKTGKVKREKPTMTKKKNKQVPCYNCPNCRVCCSSEDAMLDHFIRKHSSWKVDRPDTLYNQEDEINVPSNIHCHRDTEETPQQDDNAANEDQVNVPSHFFFQRDTDETPQQDVDTSQLLLILSNDVELNPGPTFSCKWTSCFKKFINYGELSAHIVCHIEGTNRCQWEDCHECFSAVRRFELHLLRHLYDNSEIFKTIDEWKNTLPDGKINEQRTDLHMCPLHLRSKLMLLLFDEDFSIPTGYYTIEEHYKYLELLNIPDNTCPCGSGWLKREDDDNYSENGLTIHERQRTLTIYTNFAPVKCDIHIRECYNSISKPCRILWDEGDLDCIHVLSRDTAAGDEIGWEFVSMVMNSSCTFSSYCQFKNEMYKTRHNKARFMDQTVFLNFWFSWASNMKIDFRIPCGVCGYGPKRLCCDGTKVGVGFRNSNYEEITETNQALGINNTLHRRMDRCFLKNLNGIDKQEMINLRTTLDYIARKELNEIKENEIIPERDLLDRIELLKQALPSEVLGSFERFYQMSDNERVAYSNVLKMLATTASITSLVPPAYCYKIQLLLNSPNIENDRFNSIVNETRSFAPELRDLICESLISNNEILPDDIRLFLQYLINESMSLQVTEPEPPVPQLGTYNPEKFGRAYYFNESGLKLRSVRKFSIDNDSCVKRNIDHDDATLEFEKCQKLYSKVQTSARGTSTLFLWFCADHGHCYGFHMTGAEGRKDPALSLYSYLETPPQDVFYDFACNLQEYCLNRESGYYKNVRFFHDIFHGYSHKCSNAFTASRLQGFESVNSEICEQFNSFIQCIKRSARQMSQSHFCFYLQFFLNEWNKKKKLSYEKKIRIALAGLV
ncbi:uncharacterized protein LOC127863007 isoform X8 [Dreissena polymorpha]|uniref:uncharacterized protein LOC127863007 isoform X8 n=1 Tax=Dreissena polymorpha TaxID=45954 RepID=UPI002263B172|nr:uncharacterized protein LOC127863007 isoform X8 [Dreissena polymorpha]